VASLIIVIIGIPILTSLILRLDLDASYSAQTVGGIILIIFGMLLKEANRKDTP
jgi:hypothetical protein